MRPSRLSLLAPLVALIAIGSTACGDDAATGSGGAGATGATTTSGSGGGLPGDPCSQPENDACRIDQKACRVGEDGAPACLDCGRGEHADATGACVPLTGEVMIHAFSDFTTSPGEEVRGLCQSWTLGNDAEVWVNAVELVQDGMSHHSNWTFAPEDRFPGEDGVWDCDERGYDQVSAAVAGGVLYAQSTQADREVQKFPDGAVVRIPPRAMIIGDVHLLNVGDTDVTGHIELSLYTLPESEIRVKLAPFHMTYDALEIPPRTRSRFEGTCDTSELGEPGDTFDLYYVVPHTHALGRRFLFDPITGGESDILFDVEGFNGEARGRAYDPPIPLRGATGLRFGCEFDNPRDETVTWGFGDLEMCEILGFIEAPFSFQSRISEAVPQGEVDGMSVYSGACETLMIPWESKQE